MVGGDSSFVIGDFANQLYNTCIRNKQSNSPTLNLKISLSFYYEPKIIQVFLNDSKYISVKQYHFMFPTIYELAI